MTTMCLSADPSTKQSKMIAQMPFFLIFEKTKVCIFSVQEHTLFGLNGALARC